MSGHCSECGQTGPCSCLANPTEPADVDVEGLCERLDGLLAYDSRGDVDGEAMAYIAEARSDLRTLLARAQAAEAALAVREDEATVERVARGLCEQDIRVKRRWDTEPAALEAMIAGSVDYSWDDYRDPALAAIRALGSPSGETGE